MTGKGKPKQGDMETWIDVRHFDADMTVETYRTLPKNPLYIVLDNLRSAFNVGAIFRLCDGMRVSGLYLCGCTAFPPHVKLEKTSMSTVDFVPWKRFASTIDAVKELREQHIPVWAAETTSQSKRYLDCVFPDAVAIVFGNEALGVEKEVLDLCDELVEIPLYGFKNSLNVATSCAVLGFKALETMAVNKKATAGLPRRL
jgi:23S rRNA (guanosine2251-2'-O)-methyltransferase